jgi:hypothetical protein
MSFIDASAYCFKLKKKVDLKDATNHRIITRKLNNGLTTKILIAEYPGCGKVSTIIGNQKGGSQKGGAGKYTPKQRPIYQQMKEIKVEKDIIDPKIKAIFERMDKEDAKKKKTSQKGGACKQKSKVSNKRK